MNAYARKMSQLHTINYGRGVGAGTGELGAHTRLSFLVVGVSTWLLLTRRAPEFSILGLDALLCIYLASVLQGTISAVLAFHPLILFAASHLFASPFLDAGDGRAYVEVTRQYFDSGTLSFFGSSLLSDLSALGFLKYASLGILPVVSAPEYVFGQLPDRMYYLWQGTLHLSLCCVVVTLAKGWDTFDRRTLRTIGLFSAASPSMLDLGAAPTRHIVTFFGIFLLFVTHISLYRKVTAPRLIWYCGAIVTTLISKAPLLLAYGIFVLVDLFVVQRRVSRATLILLFAIVLGSAELGPTLIGTTVDYLHKISTSGAGAFGALANVPLVGWVVKYLYALLAPFPWFKAKYFIDTIYSGNPILFVAHIFSSLTGLYLFLSLILRAKRIAHSNDNNLKQMLAFGLVMSTSILGGSTGFHVYILIYFPMLAPLLLHRDLRINPLLPFCVVVPLEAFLLIAGQ